MMKRPTPAALALLLLAGLASAARDAPAQGAAPEAAAALLFSGERGADKRWMGRLSADNIERYISRQDAESGRPVFALNAEALLADGFPQRALDALAGLVETTNAFTAEAEAAAPSAAAAAKGQQAAAPAAQGVQAAAACDTKCTYNKFVLYFSRAKAIIDKYLPVSLRKAVSQARLLPYMLAYFRMYGWNNFGAALRYALTSVLGGALSGVVIVYTIVPAIIFWLTTVPSY